MDSMPGCVFFHLTPPLLDCRKPYALKIRIAGEPFCVLRPSIHAASARMRPAVRFR
jgi:hypothetical protein